MTNDMAGSQSTLESFAPFAGAAMSTAGQFYSANQSKSIAKKQIAAQKEENALTRQFNMDEAQKARDYSTAMQKAYQEYNTPAAQARRMEEAGYHPMSLLGNVQPGDYGITSSPTASSSGSLSPVGVQQPNFDVAARTLAETRLINAQADAAEAKAAKDEADTNTIDSMRDGLITLQDLEIEYSRKFKEAQLLQLRSMAESLNQGISESKERMNQIVAQTNVLRQQAISTELDNAWKDKTFDTRVKQESARLHISEQEYRYMVASFTMRLANLRADTDSKLASALRDSAMGKMLDSNREINEKRWDMFHQIE